MAETLAARYSILLDEAGEGTRTLDRRLGKPRRGRRSATTDGESLAINESGQIVGGNRLWQNRKTTDLGTLPGRTFTAAAAINEHGQVICTSYGEGNDAQWDQRHAFIWQNGKMTDLGTLPERAFSDAVGLNERGQVAGFSCDEGEGNCRAFVWERGTLTDLGTLPGGSDSRAVAINEKGQIAPPSPASATPSSGRSAAADPLGSSGRLGLDPYQLPIVMGACADAPTIRSSVRLR